MPIGVKHESDTLPKCGCASSGRYTLYRVLVHTHHTWVIFLTCGVPLSGLVLSVMGRYPRSMLSLLAAAATVTTWLITYATALRALMACVTAC